MAYEVNGVRLDERRLRYHLLGWLGQKLNRGGGLDEYEAQLLTDLDWLSYEPITA